MSCEHKYQVKWTTPDLVISDAIGALEKQNPVLAMKILTTWQMQKDAQREVDRAISIASGETPCPECPPETDPGVQVVDGTKK